MPSLLDPIPVPEPKSPPPIVEEISDQVPHPPPASIPVVVEVKAPTAIEAITEIAKETPKEVTEEDKAKENLQCKVVLKKLTKSNKYYIEIRKNNRFLTSIFKKRCSL